MDAWRRLPPLLAAAALAAPATAAAQSSAPDGGPALSQRPPGQRKAAPSAPSAPSAAAPSATGLPRTGTEVPAIALMGMGLLVAGVGLRLRTVDETIY